MHTLLLFSAPPLQLAQPPPEPDSSSSTSTSCNCLEKITHSAIYAELQYVLTLRFIVFTSALGISLGVLVVNWILLTAYAVDRGVSLTNAVLLSSIGAMTDTVGRILSGFLFDISFFKRFRVQTFNFILLLNGAVMLGLAFAYHYYMMVALVMLSYVCSAVMTSQRQVILVDLFGVDTLPTTLPFTLAMQGVGLMFIPALCGKSTHDLTLELVSIITLLNSIKCVSIIQHIFCLYKHISHVFTSCP